MPRKKVDNRIKSLIENGIKENHRSFFVIIGDRGKDQVVKLHYILSKSAVRAQPSVLWCYKSELGFSSNRKKRMKMIKKKVKQGLIDPEKDDPFELFMTATNIRWTYYKDTANILGNTYGMCILQDFEAITPNILARTIETVSGGGMIVMLLKTMNSLKQLYTMALDIHNRFRTDAHQDIVPRFNERFLLSLISCSNSIVLDDELNILPVSLASRNIPLDVKQTIENPQEQELKVIKESMADTQPAGSLIEKTKTLDQAKALLTFIEAISEKTLRSTVALTAARGRGKSAALGLAIAASIGFGYSNIFVTSPSPENLKTLFEFIFIGFDAMGYTEHTDYELIQSTNPAFNKAIVRVNVFKTHRQVIQYIIPTDAAKLGQAELVVIDEAAAIPLPQVKALLGPYLVFLSSTVNGYEGTGRSLSLKLIKELRAGAASPGSVGGRVFREVVLEDPIRYSRGDPVEKWLNGLLCFDAANIKPISSSCPFPSECELFYVNRDTLFSYHKVSEEFLQRMMSLYVSSHYKNSPNDLILMSDAPAHHLFVLLPPVTEETKTLPEVLCVIQVALEGEISKEILQSSITRGKRPSGDLIPWNVSMQFQDDNFPTLSGARVVRIATHPDFARAGYGTRALELLQAFYEGKMQSTDIKKPEVQPQPEAPSNPDDNIHNEKLRPRKNLPPLLNKLTEVTPEQLHWLGVSYGLTTPLYGFWKKSGFLPVYIRLSELSSTGEHTCIMLKSLNSTNENGLVSNSDWLVKFHDDFTTRFVTLLGYDFRKFNCRDAVSVMTKYKEVALEVPDSKTKIFFGNRNTDNITKQDLDRTFSVYDLKRLESYTKNLLDYHAILDTLPQIGRLFFAANLSHFVPLSPSQYCILVGLGLQFKNVDTVADELDIKANQVLALFNKAMRKIVKFFISLEEAAEDKLLPATETGMHPTALSLEEDLKQIDDEFKANEEMKMEQQSLISELARPEFAIQGDNKDWEEAALSLKRSKIPNILSVKRKKTDEEPAQPEKKRKTSQSKSAKRKSTNKKT
uniref:RNA cytidine acetyltransferase n=1 Tax=Arcella intermedia TaxID=1963864 RepID=A0A6B2KWW6_9EUKA|eukprot:TRINITY_DN1337_c0_g1_i1.p1 TRINITY_DN1337_c0_g1~~TRINITY_DN1337_c0_g1_i1.p1  ORF type:complete len:1027 (-),score=238.02 TRINITY_DN1337_c0_g1_i1:43-3123(-)